MSLILPDVVLGNQVVGLQRPMQFDAVTGYIPIKSQASHMVLKVFCTVMQMKNKNLAHLIDCMTFLDAVC
jgi:hypothetical protein